MHLTSLTQELQESHVVEELMLICGYVTGRINRSIPTSTPKFYMNHCTTVEYGFTATKYTYNLPINNNSSST